MTLHLILCYQALNKDMYYDLYCYSQGEAISFFKKEKMENAQVEERIFPFKFSQCKIW